MIADISDSKHQKYDDMSRDELLSIIGPDVDPNTSREDLIVMALAVDSTDV